MASTLVSIEGVPVAKGRRGKPRLLVRGRRRKAAVKALHHLQVLENQDFAENTRAAKNFYTPYLILGTPGSKVDKAFDTLTTALNDALKAKA